VHPLFLPLVSVEKTLAQYPTCALFLRRAQRSPRVKNRGKKHNELSRTNNYMRCRDWIKIKNIAHPAIERAMLIALSKRQSRM
jgi:hypothetical protein